MFGIGSTELLVILIVALLVLGPKNLPKIAHTLGKALGEFRRVSTDFQRTLNTEIAFEEDAEKHKKAADATVATPTATASAEAAPPVTAADAAAEPTVASTDKTKVDAGGDKA